MENQNVALMESFIDSKTASLISNNKIDRATYDRYDVKRGLRNKDGTGVVAGLTNIGNVIGYEKVNGIKTPVEGHLVYRGYHLHDLVHGFLAQNRPGFEETTYLLLFGELPDADSLANFRNILSSLRPLPDGFVKDMILSAPSQDIMNKMARSILALYSYDPSPDPEPGNLSKEILQAIQLIARMPVVAAYALAAKRHYYDNESLVIHNPVPELSTAENFLHSIRADGEFTPEEARILDLCLVVHAEHGGGNNSAFACRVLSSSGTDIYSCMAAAVGSLKGPRHGGANRKVMEMFRYIENEVNNWEDETELASYLTKILKKEVAARDGLIYGMGHAIYTLSDPRAVLLKELAGDLAATKGMLREYELVERVEKLTPKVFKEVTGIDKVMCANVDLYSGLVYKMLGIPEVLYTPLFVISRITGWCSHRIEEVFSDNKIIRPAYHALTPEREYISLENR